MRHLCFLILAGWLAGAAKAAPASSFPIAASKKGLQVQMVDDALALGIQHAGINLNLTGLVDLRGNTNNPSWTNAGQVFYFQRGYLQNLEREIKPLSDRGVLVYLILLTYASGDPQVNQRVLHPNYDAKAPNRLGAFNTTTDAGRQWFTACLEFLAALWSGADSSHGRVVGYIVGNEVTSHWWWANMGRVTMTEFADDYLRTVRLFHTAIRRQSPWARVYLSLDHHWNIRYAAGDDRQTYAGRPFLDYFAAQARKGGDFDWHLAYHPYPENLFEPRFWRDKTATTNANTPRITFKNLEVLMAYLDQPELRYQGQPRRVILSEQGFHTPDGPDGELIQAAAYCYAYKKVEQTEGIDAFILHRHVDHAHEGGLKLGLWRNQAGTSSTPAGKKRIYECFRLADTPQWREAFAFALPVIGLNEWPAPLEKARQ